MPRVPTYDSPQVNPTTAGVAAPSVSAISVAGRQLEQAGAQVSDGGRSLGNVAMQLQQQVNQTRAQQAANALTNKMTAYRYGSTDANGVRTPGYSEIKGEAAMHVAGPDGKTMPLQQAYGARLQKDIDEIAGGLSNDEQRRIFMAHAGNAQAEFANETGAHQAQQMQVWAKGVAQDQVVSAANALASAPNDPAIWAVQSANLRDGINKQLAQAGVITLSNDPYGYPVVANPDRSTWDKRADGSTKGMGWLGLRQRPDGGVSSEISVGVTINGKEQEIPLMVPGLTKPEVDYLMTHDPDQEKNPNFLKDMPPSILEKATAFAKQRIADGKSPFRGDGETTTVGQPGTSHIEFASDEARQVYDVESKSMMAAAFGTVVKSLRDNGQAVAALNFIDAHKDEVSQTDYKQLRGSVLEQANASIAIDAVDKLIPKLWPDHTQSPNMEALGDALRKQFHDDPMMLRASLAELSSRVSEWTFTHQQQSNDAQQAAYNDIASGKSLPYLQSRPYWSQLQGGDKLKVIEAAQGFADSRISHIAGAAGRAGDLNADYVGYAVSKGMPEHIARAMAAVFSGETNNDPNAFNPAGGGQGAFGLFQARGDLQRGLKQRYGANPTWQQQIDFYSDLISKTPQVAAAGNETDAVRAMVQYIQKPGKDTDALIARSLGVLNRSAAAQDQNYNANADAMLADPASIGRLTPQNVQRIQNMAGPKYAPSVIAAAQKWQRETTRAALPSATEMNAVLSQLSIPTGTTKDPKVLAMRAQIRASLQGVLMNEAKEGAIITDPAQRQDILQKAAATTVQVFHDTYFAGFKTGRVIRDVPLLSLSKEDRAAMIVPEEERAAIADSLRRHGKPVTDNNLRKAWLQSQGLSTEGL